MGKYLKKNQTISDREDIARTRIGFGNLSALALRNALRSAEIEEDNDLWGLYYKILRCALPTNHWVAEDLHNEETGECFPGNNNFWGCGSRLCPSCVAKLSRRMRKEVRAALSAQRLLVGENYQFITFTMPNPCSSLLLTREIMNYAQSLMRKREYFKEKIRGGVKAEEFTVTKNRYHYHLHYLAITRFLSFEKFRVDWTDCLEISFKKFGVPFEVNTADGLVMVKIERVSGRKNLNDTVLEVCKYITKSDSWEKIPESDLIEIAAIKRFPRMFELFGSFRHSRKEEEKEAQVTENCQETTNFDSERHILDTKAISDGKNLDLDAFSGNSPPMEKEKRPRPMNWRLYIEKYGLQSYLIRLSDEIKRTQEWRKSALRMKYPYAVFYTCDNASF